MDVKEKLGSFFADHLEAYPHHTYYLDWILNEESMNGPTSHFWRENDYD